MKILLTGKDGQVGWELAKSIGPSSDLVALGRADLDMRRPQDVRKVVREQRPDLVLNAAAYTAVDKAESEKALAMTVNGHAVAALAEECRRIGTALLHFSTDYVFDGKKNAPYTESDIPNPINAYGESKLFGEQAMVDSGVRGAILRTAWVYANRGKNFFLTVRKLAREREELKIVSDQYGSPTWARALAEGALRVARGFLDHNEPYGGTAIYHMTCAGTTTWYEFAKAILDAARASHDTKSNVTHVVPISTDQYPTSARRPQYSVLSNAKLKAEFGVELPEWRRAFQLCLEVEHSH